MQIISRQEAKQFGLPRFFTGRVCRNGHLDERFVSDGSCVTCGNERSRRRRSPGFAQNLEERIAARNRLAEENSILSGIPIVTRDEAVAAGATHYYTGIPCPKGHNSERFVSGRICVACVKEKRLEAPTRAYISSLSRVYRSSELYGRHLLGISMKGFKRYIEDQFVEGMSWDNYGTFWELDHRLPLCSFDLSNQDDLKVCAHYTNIRPMTPSENRKKYQESDIHSARGLIGLKQKNFVA